MRRSPRSRVIALLLAAVLAATPALAARHEPAPALRQASGVFASLWQALERFLPSLTKTLGTIDPNGEPAPAGNAIPGGEKGRAGLDPDGEPAPAGNATSGGETEGRGTIDPNG